MKRTLSARSIGLSSGLPVLLAMLLTTPTAAQPLTCEAPEIVNPGVTLHGTPFNYEGDSRRLHPYLMSEELGDLNGDGDLLDVVVGVYDAHLDHFRSLGIAYDWEASSHFHHLESGGDLLLFLAREDHQGRDLNGDGDQVDRRLLMIWDARRQRLISTGLTLGNILDDRFDPLVDVGGDRAAIVVREMDTGRDLNRDGDFFDRGTFLYESSQARLRWLGMGGGRLDGDWLVISRPESALGTDVNNDGDLDDDVPELRNLSTGARATIPIAANTFAVSGHLVLLIVLEAFEGNRDLNGDGDSNDAIGAVYDLATGASHFLRQSVASVGGQVFEGRWWFSSSEADDRQDYNADGDQRDEILFVYEIASRRLTNLGLAGGPLPLAGGRALVNVLESVNQTDLNGDGDIDDVVLHHWDASSGRLRNLKVEGRCRFREGARVVMQVSESDLRSDLNGDGDQNDSVGVRWDVQRNVVAPIPLAIRSLGASGIHDARLVVEVSEADQGGNDLNGDGDNTDLVFHVVDLVTGAIANLGYECSLDAWLGDEAFLFLASEVSRQQDLNGDGDRFDSVLLAAHLPDLEWSLEGAPIPGGPPVSFTARSAPLEIGNDAAVAISLGDGSSSGGILLPNSGGRTLGLDLDPLLVLWARMPKSLREARLNGCIGASTQSFTIPVNAPNGLRIYYAGFSFDGTGTVSAISATESVMLQ